MLIRIHPLSRLVLVILITFCAVLLHSPLLMLFIVMITVLLLLSKSMSGSEKERLIKLIIRLIPLFISIFIIQVLFTREGNQILSFYFVRITDKGLSSALEVTLRLIILLLSAALLWGIKPREFLVSFRILRIPETFTILLMMTIRFLPVLLDKIKIVLIQMKLRGILVYKLSLAERAGLFRGLLLSVLGRALKDVGYKAVALDLKGFRNSQKHTKYGQTSLVLSDYLVIGFAIALSVGVVALS